MKLKTETKYLIELDDREVNELFDQISKLMEDVHYNSPLAQLKSLLWPVRHGH